MSTAFAFTAGWQDRLLGLSPQVKFMGRRQGIAFAYERGRHVAALYQLDVQRRGGTINTATPFKMAYKEMSKELRALVRAENKFMAMPRRRSVFEQVMTERYGAAK